jgi:DNA end-binding protein Ku
LFYPDELRAANQPAIQPGKKASSKELSLAKSLIQHLAGPFEPAEFHDSYREAVEQLIEQKRKGEKITPIRRTKKAPVTDLMEALRRSLDSGAGKAAKAHTSLSKSSRKHRAA